MQTKGLRKNKFQGLSIEAMERRQIGADYLFTLFNGKELTEGKTYHVMTAGKIDYLSNLLWLIRRYGRLKKVFLAAFSFGSEEIAIIRSIQAKKKIEHLDVLVHDVFHVKHEHEYREALNMHASAQLQNFYEYNLHCKFIVCETFTGEKITIVTSANGTNNPRIEIEVISCSEKLYDFYDKETRRIINKLARRQSIFHIRTNNTEIRDYELRSV